MITTIKLINVSITSLSYDVFMCGKTLDIYSFGKFQVHSEVLLIIATMLYIRLLEHISLA